MIYKKSILEKIKSPENLDSMQEITKPLNYLMVIGGVITVTAAIMYLIFWI